MLEIFILITLGKNIAAKARAKGLSGALFVVLLLVFWLGGEIGGAVIAAVVSTAVMGDPEPNMLMVYPAALVGAVLGAVLAFLIVKVVGSNPTHDEDDYERYDRRDRDRDYDRN